MFDQGPIGIPTGKSFSSENMLIPLLNFTWWHFDITIILALCTCFLAKTEVERQYNQVKVNNITDLHQEKCFPYNAFIDALDE